MELLPVLQPPDTHWLYGPIAFLNGPIQGAPNWQKRAIGHLRRLYAAHYQIERLIQLAIANPRRSYLPGAFNYEAQVDWETYYRQAADKWGVNLFWFPREIEHDPARAYAQTSRVEIGESMERGSRYATKLAVGIEEGFSGERYLRRRLGQQCPGIIIHDNLEATCRAALDLL